MAKKIGIDLRLTAYQMGGISQYALHLLPALAQIAPADVQFHIVHSRKDRRNHTPNHPQFKRNIAWTPCHHTLEKWALAAEITPHALDVWHSPDFIPPAFGAKRRVITVHDLNFLHYPHYLTAESRRYYNEQIQWAVDTADVIAADSEHTRQDVIDLLHVDPTKIHTIYLAANPIYSQTYTQSAIDQTLAQHNLPRDFILFVGTIEPRKNIPHLIRTYHQLRDEIDVPLVIVGRKGWLADDVFDLIQSLDLSGRVRHLTGLYDEPLAHLYRAAGVLVLPSHYEGFGLPPLEAMHSGCPVITSDRGSLPEIVGDAGMMLPADDVPAWADGIRTVLCDTAFRTQMIEAGYNQAQKFNWRTTAEQTLRLYTET